MAHPFTDPQIIEAVCSGGYVRENAWRYVAEHWSNYCTRIVIKVTRCQSVQAMEAFSHAVVGADNRIRSAGGQHFLKTATLKSYLTQSAIYAAWAILRREKKVEMLKDEEFPGSDNDDWFRRKNCREIMENALSILGERCKKILLMFNDDFNMKEIAEEMGFANEDVAKKEKYGCQKKFIAQLCANPQIRNLLTENCYD